MPKTVRYFYDCEFLENGKTIDLISIGIYSEDGREFYAVSDAFDTMKVATNEWLMENVMSSIEHKVIERRIPNLEGVPTYLDLEITDPALKSRKEIREGILDFVKGTWPELWAWYGAYDHVALCQLFGRMIDLPKNFPMFTMDIKQVQKQLGVLGIEMPTQPEGLHNALADAKFNKTRFDYLLAVAEYDAALPEGIDVR